jgi:oligopeptide/dipeptide ABC transporter ATP-binding protein
VEHISREIAVMYLGRIVERAPRQAIYNNPLHPYTKSLLAAIPRTDPDEEKSRQNLPGDVPSPVSPPEGCHFHPRCPGAQGICREETPELREISPEHYVRCHRAEELA